MTRRQQAIIGVGFLCLGIMLGDGLRFIDMHLLHSIRQAIIQEDAGSLLFIAAQVTAINTLRVLPLYLGAFVLMERWVTNEAVWWKRVFGYMVPAALVYGSYVAIRVLFHVPYDFGVPALLSLLGVIVVHAISQSPQGLFFKMATFGVFSFGWQWLGIAPSLTGYGFGNGDLSAEVKIVVSFLEQEALFDQWSLLSCCGFVVLAFVMAKFMVDYGNHMDLLKRHQQQQLQLERATLKNLEARSQMEMQRLVHDLKTPLTTVQGLVGLISMPQLKKERIVEYSQRIEHSVERMDQMISEILHPEVKQVVSGMQLIRFLHSHVSNIEQPSIRFDVGRTLPDVRVNVVRMTRALANLIQNAHDAMAGTSTPVQVRVRAVAGKLRIRIRDYGRGISKDAMRYLFVPGFSTKESSGLGLSFASEVIRHEHRGELRVYSVPESGTCFVVELEGEHHIEEASTHIGSG